MTEIDIDTLAQMIVDKHARECVQDENAPCGWVMGISIFDFRCDFPSSHTVPCTAPEPHECEGYARICCFHYEMHRTQVGRSGVN